MFGNEEIYEFLILLLVYFCFVAEILWRRNLLGRWKLIWMANLNLYLNCPKFDFWNFWPPLDTKNWNTRPSPFLRNLWGFVKVKLHLRGLEFKSWLEKKYFPVNRGCSSFLKLYNPSLTMFQDLSLLTSQTGFSIVHF